MSDDEWVALEPQRGHPDRGLGVTLAVRKTGSGNGPRPIFCIGTHVVRQLGQGWNPKDHVFARLNRAGTVIEFRPGADKATGWCLQSRGDTDLRNVQPSIPWRLPPRKAEPVNWEVLAGGVLRVTLPTWARETDEGEAEEMILAGRGAKALVDELGWSLERAQKFANEVRARRQKEAA